MSKNQYVKWTLQLIFIALNSKYVGLSNKKLNLRWQVITGLNIGDK